MTGIEDGRQEKSKYITCPGLTRQEMGMLISNNDL